MPRFALADRLTTWWRARQRRRAWAAMSPEQQMFVWAKAINANPELRDAFRRVLRVRGYETTVKGPK